MKFKGMICASVAGRPSTSSHVVAVSYTHLDVYKRQVAFRILLGHGSAGGGDVHDGSPAGKMITEQKAEQVGGSKMCIRDRIKGTCICS